MTTFIFHTTFQYHNNYQLMRKEYFGFNEKAWSDEDWLEVGIHSARSPKP